MTLLDSSIKRLSSRSANIELLLCCAQISLDQGETVCIQHSIRRGVSWERVLDLARHHGLLLTLNAKLRSLDQAIVPADIVSKLQNSVNCRARHDRQLPVELVTIFRLLRAKEIPLLAFRGPALAALAYRDPTLRQSGDLDILVRPGDVERIRLLLAQRGYRPTEPWESGENIEACSLALLEKGLIVDIHWGLSRDHFPFQLPFEELWRRRKTLTMAGGTIDTLGVSDTLLTACVLGARSRWMKLKWVCDVAELICRLSLEIDWAQVLPYARRAGAERMVGLGLLLGNRILGAELHSGVRDQVLASKALESLAEQVEEWLLGEDQLTAERPDGLMFLFRVRDSFDEEVQIV